MPKQQENTENTDATRKERWRKYKEDKVRWSTWSSREEYELIVEKAAECGLSFNEYVRRCAIGRKTIPRTDAKLITTLSKLGGLQNKIMSDIREQLGLKNNQEVTGLVDEARKIYREIHLAVRRIKKKSDQE